MGYVNGLEWMKKLKDFTEDQQRLLLALSHQKYVWRTKDRLQEVTAIPSDKLEAELSELIAKDLIRPSLSKKKNIIFGLRERVG